MHLKETGAGEVTVWLAEMLVTLGATDEEQEAAQRNERGRTNHNTCERLPAHYLSNSFMTSHTALSYLSTLRTWLPNGRHYTAYLYTYTSGQFTGSTQSVGALYTSH